MAAPSVRTMAPVGIESVEREGAIATLKVTGLPKVDGFRLLVKEATVMAPLTTTWPVAVEARKLSSPFHAAESASVPMPKVTGWAVAVADPVVMLAASRSAPLVLAAV